MSDIHAAELDWDADGQPLSRAFGDVYFSRASGLDETRYVFLGQNRLAERFAALPLHGHITVGETGFGTGLNFLCTWALFREQAPASARLHFISVEKYPLSWGDLRRALSLWPELGSLSEGLLRSYRAIHPGYQRLLFDDGRVVLTLLIDDVLDALPTLDARVDAWFLDGFSPAKNPAMWTPELFSQLARLSAPAATLATFTCAGFVRRGLNEAGFAMAKVKGFGHKREMLAGHIASPAATSAKPWFARPPGPRGERRAFVVGAGLAGCATARSLAQRGWDVTVLERHAEVASEASGNPQGVLYLKLSAHHTALSRLVVGGFGYTRRLLEDLPRGREWDDCGVLQLAHDERETQRQDALAAAFPAPLLRRVTRQEASALAGIEVAGSGLWFPDAGWVHPPALCRRLMDHPRIRLKTHREVVSLSRTDDGEWQLNDGQALLGKAPIVVLCGAADVPALAPAAHLPLKRIRGQITALAETASSRALRTVICAEGYVAPARDRRHTLGASFDFDADSLEVKAEEHRSNLKLLNGLSADLAQALACTDDEIDGLEGRAAFRCTSPDYLPMVGPLAHAEQFVREYGVLARDARQVPAAACPWLEGLFINCAHGSRGLITAPLSGELVAAWIDGEALPVPQAVAEACHPNRFVLRRLIRGG